MHDQPILPALFCLNILDIASGTLAAWQNGGVSSKMSWRGATRKLMVWLVLGALAIFDQFTPDIPEVKIGGVFYIITELLSIFENAVRAGLPVPEYIRARLTEAVNAANAGASAKKTTSVNVQTDLSGSVPEKLSSIDKKES
jgi:toxin secretion/phage lysis holin